MLRKFATLRGWLSVISSDPGSQLVSAAGKMKCWWAKIEGLLQSLACQKGFRWSLSPANSPWRQGKTERRIGVIKRLLKISMNDVWLMTLELQLFLMEAANITNCRPISIQKRIPADGSYKILTPNDLILGRASGKPVVDDGTVDFGKKSKRAQLVAEVTDHFWKRWASEAAPIQII